MTNKDALLSYDDFISHLSKKGVLPNDTIQELKSHWPYIHHYAQLLLPQIKNNNIYTQKQLLSAYQSIETTLQHLVNKQTITDLHKSFIEDLLTASNKGFAKARKIYPKLYNPDHTAKPARARDVFRDIVVIALVFATVIAALDLKNHTFSQIFWYLASNYSGKTTGTITKSNLVRSYSKYSIVLHPHVEYQYKVNNQVYTSNDAVVFDRYEIKNARQFLHKYPVGREVTIYYDKRWPRFSVLELTPPRFEDWQVFILGVLFAIGLTSVVTSIFPTRVIRLNMYIIWAILIFVVIVSIIVDQTHT